MVPSIPNKRVSKGHRPPENVNVWTEKSVQKTAQKELEQSWEWNKKMVPEKEREFGWKE